MNSTVHGVMRFRCVQIGVVADRDPATFDTGFMARTARSPFCLPRSSTGGWTGSILQPTNVRLRLRSFIVDATVEGSSKMLAVVI